MHRPYHGDGPGGHGAHRQHTGRHGRQCGRDDCHVFPGTRLRLSGHAGVRVCIGPDGGQAGRPGALTTVINCKTGVARMLGLERRAGKGEDLDAYLRRTAAEAVRARQAASSSNEKKANGTHSKGSQCEGPAS
jgi:hypothetical protein